MNLFFFSFHIEEKWPGERSKSSRPLSLINARQTSSSYIFIRSTEVYQLRGRGGGGSVSKQPAGYRAKTLRAGLYSRTTENLQIRPRINPRLELI